MALRSIVRGTFHVAWMLAVAYTVSALVHRAGQPNMEPWVSLSILALIRRHDVPCPDT